MTWSHCRFPRRVQTYCYPHPEDFSLAHRAYDGLREPPRRVEEASLPRGGSPRRTARSRVDEYCHRVSSEPAEGSHSWNVSPNKSSATRWNHNSTTRALSPSEYLVSLYSSHFHFRPWNSNFLSTEVMLRGNVPNLQIQKCPVHMLVSSSLDHTSWVCMHPHTPGLALYSSLTTISATLSSRFRIPADDVTVNWSSVQVVCLIRVQPVTKRCGSLDWDPSPLSRTREHDLHQKLNGLLA